MPVRGGGWSASPTQSVRSASDHAHILHLRERIDHGDGHTNREPWWYYHGDNHDNEELTRKALDVAFLPWNLGTDVTHIFFQNGSWLPQPMHLGDAHGRTDVTTYNNATATHKKPTTKALQRKEKKLHTCWHQINSELLYKVLRSTQNACTGIKEGTK
jgi:hypothetical protein